MCRRITNMHLGHVTPESGSPCHIKRSLVNFLKEKFDLTELSDLVAVGTDGTVMNTGVKNGVIRLLEK